MQNKFFLAGVVLALFLWTGSAAAQMMGGNPAMMQDYAKQHHGPMQTPQQGSYMDYPDMMAGGYGPGSCFMNGYAMGSGMMGGYGMDGMRPNHHGGMMGGYGMRPGMMGFSSSSKYDAFMDATKELRKKMHSLRFEYGEMMRDPETTMGDLQKKKREMFELQQQILEKKTK